MIPKSSPESYESYALMSLSHASSLQVAKGARLCIKCGCRMSMYNKGNECFSHSEESDRDDGRVMFGGLGRDRGRDLIRRFEKMYVQAEDSSDFSVGYVHEYSGYGIGLYLVGK